MRTFTKIAALCAVLALPVVAYAVECVCGPQCSCPICPCGQARAK